MEDLGAFSISGTLWVLDSQVAPMDDEGAQINILKGKEEINTVLGNRVGKRMI